jgi:hypothetical protein
MPRFVFRMALVLTTILSCTAMSAYILARVGGDYQSVRDFLSPVDGCPAPCWQGIRPGITDSLEAVDRLRAMPWAKNLYAIQGIIINDSYISWTWDGSPLDVVDSKRDGRMWFHNGLVYSIEIPLVIPFSSIWGAFGAPEVEMMLKAPLTPPQVFYVATYLGGTVAFRSTVICPPAALNPLTARVDVHFEMTRQGNDLTTKHIRPGCENSRC